MYTCMYVQKIISYIRKTNRNKKNRNKITSCILRY